MSNISSQQLDPSTQQIIKDSIYAGLHIWKKGNTQIPAASTSITINHNLGYIPAHLLFTKVGSDYCPVPFLSPSVVSPLSVYATVNETEIKIYKNNSSFSQEIFYIIFRDQLA